MELREMEDRKRQEIKRSRICKLWGTMSYFGLGYNSLKESSSLGSKRLREHLLLEFESQCYEYSSQYF